MVDCLLRRCVAEDDPELLLLLLEEGLGPLAGPGVLQQVLEYAVAHQELQVVQEVLALGSGELSQAVSGFANGKGVHMKCLCAGNLQASFLNTMQPTVLVAVDKAGVSAPAAPPTAY
jgi:hypothetical protein